MTSAAANDSGLPDDVNAVVAYNLKAIRTRRGMTQQNVAEVLGQLTGHQLPQASISAMERTIDGGRRRRFDAHELYLLAIVFDVPVTYFFLPPPGFGRPTAALLGALLRTSGRDTIPRPTAETDPADPEAGWKATFDAWRWDRLTHLTPAEHRFRQAADVLRSLAEMLGDNEP